MTTLSATASPLLFDQMEDLEALQALGGLAPLPPAEAARDAPDAHLALVEGSSLRARCSLWWRTVPAYPERRVGLVGHYAAKSDDAAAQLLTSATQTLAAQGCTLLLGPMDGATWRPYRFVVDAGTRPPFFLEPNHPSSYPRQFARAGFVPLAHYRSALVETVPASLPRPTPSGFCLRPLQMDRLEAELGLLHTLTTACFEGNLLYTPPPSDDFVARHAALRHLVEPDLVLIAEHEKCPVGYCFLLPDVLQARRGEAVDTIIFKTLALLPSWRGQGLGSWLTATAHEQAYALGYRRAIHALMYEGNVSSHISQHYGQTMRRYALFALDLG